MEQTNSFITMENFEAFKEAYDTAVANSEEVFWFEEQQILTDYAKYVVQYLTNNPFCV